MVLAVPDSADKLRSVFLTHVVRMDEVRYSNDQAAGVFETLIQKQSNGDCKSELEVFVLNVVVCCRRCSHADANAVL